jgi:hypothetical protein
MPFIIPALPAIIGAAASVGGSMLMNRGGGGGVMSFIQQQKELAQQKQDEAKKQQDAAMLTARREIPNVQSMLGGAVSPEYYAQTISANTGIGDQINPALKEALRAFGLTGMDESRFGLAQGSQFSGGM